MHSFFILSSGHLVTIRYLLSVHTSVIVNLSRRTTIFVVAAIIVTTFATLFICPVKSKTEEAYQMVDINDVHMVDGPEDNYWPYKDKWYDTEAEAFRNAEMKFYHHAELRDRFILFYGWKTHGCTIIPPYGLTKNKDGKFALTFLHDIFEMLLNPTQVASSSVFVSTYQL